MAGKPIALGSRAVAFAMDSLSKNTLIDFALDMAYRHVGEGAADELILKWVEDNLEPVHRLRGQKTVNLLAKCAAIRASDERYRAGKQTGQS